jgi:DMSO/TMAO reductase YedYZ molybdopterin-dependent catalytic subunit
MMKQKGFTEHLTHSFVAVWIMGIMGIAVCSNTEGIAADNPASNLKTAEIRQYEGRDLSSVNDFRENSIKGPQFIDQKTYRLKLTGLAGKPQTYTYGEVLDRYQHYKKMVTLNCVEGWSVTLLWEGVLVKDLIKEAKPSSKAKAVIFHAYDGYTTSFPISYIMDNNIIIAFRMNGVVIPPERGFPFQLVAESKWGYKWIKWITEIELSDNPDYKGFWESRGYSDSGDLKKSFFDDTAQ